MFKNVASQKIQLFAFDITTGAAKVGDAANITAYVSKDHGAVTVLGDTTATEMDATNAKGVYVFDLTQAETNADELTFTAKSSTANISITPRFISTVPNRFSSMVIDVAGLVDANTVKLGPTGAGTAQTARDIGASVLLSAGTGTGQLDFTAGVVKANATQWLGGTIPAVNVTGVPLVDLKYTLGTISPATPGSVRADAVTGAVGSVTGAVGSVTGSVGSVTGAVGSVTGSVGSIATGGISEASFATTAGSFAPLGIIDQGTAQGATSTTFQLRAAASFADNEIVGSVIEVTGGSAGVGQSRSIISYVAATDTATVDAWTTTPTGTITYKIWASPPPDGTAAAIKAKTDFLPSATAGAAGGLFIAGVNAPTTVTTSFTTTFTGNLTGNVGGSVGSVASGGISNASFAAGAIDAAAIADAAIDRATFATDTGMRSIRSNTAQAGASTTITLDAGASAVTDFYKNDLIVITGGTGVGQARYCTAYNGTTKVATVSAWATNPDNTSTFAVMPADAIVGATAPTAVQVADEVQTRTIAAVTLVNGFAADSITASALATSAVNEIVDQVWDEVISGHATVGTTGAALAAAGGSGDPWATVLPGSYGAGTAGKIIGDNIDALISSRAAASVLGTPAGASIAVDIAAVKTDSAAVKVKTDFLPSAAAGSAGGVFIAGSNAATSITTALTTNIIGNVTGNLSGSVGSVIGAVGSVAGLTASDVGAIKVKTDFLPSATAGSTGGVFIAGTNAATAITTALTANIIGNMTGNLSGSVGSVVGAVGSVTGLTASDVAGIKAKTDNLPASPAAVGDIPTAIENADTLLNRDMATGTDSGSPTVRTVRQALRFLRNKWTITGTTLSVKKEDDSTESWSSVVTATPGADPITGNDPA